VQRNSSFLLPITACSLCSSDRVAVLKKEVGGREMSARLAFVSTLLHVKSIVRGKKWGTAFS